MQMKSNKNGVKLLAAVMVFAMAFAGIVVMADSSDAADVTYINGTVNADTYFGENTTVVVDKDLKIVNGATLYIQNNCKFTVNEGVTITIDGAKAVEEGEEPDLATLSIENTALVNINGAISVGENGILEISDETISAPTAEAGIFVAGTVTAARGGTLDLDGGIVVKKTGTISVLSSAKISKICGDVFLNGGASIVLKGEVCEGCYLDVYAYEIESESTSPSTPSKVSSFTDVFITDGAPGSILSKISDITITAQTTTYNAYQGADKVTLSVCDLTVTGTIQGGDRLSFYSEADEGQYYLKKNSTETADLIVDEPQITISELNVARNGAIENEDANIVVDGKLTLMKEIKVNGVVSEPAGKIAVNGGTITVTGTVEMDKSCDNGVAGGYLKVMGGTVTITDAANKSDVDFGTVFGATYYNNSTKVLTICDLEVAIAAADGTNVSEITVSDGNEEKYVLSSDITVNDFIILNVDGVLEVAEENTLTVQNYGTVTKIGDSKIVVNGKVVDNSMQLQIVAAGIIECQVIKTINDGETQIFTTLKIALSDAASGDIICLVGNVDVSGKLTIPAGVTVDTNGKTVTVKIDGELVIDGVMDASEGTLTTVKSESTTKKDGVVTVNNVLLTNETFGDAFNVAGVYTDADISDLVGSKVVSIDVFVANATEDDNGTVMGKVTATDIAPKAALTVAGELTVNSITVTNGLTVDGKLVAGSITLDGSAVEVTVDGAITAVIDAADAKVALVGIKNVTVTNVVDEEEGINKIVVSGAPVEVDAKTSSMKITSGTVNAKDLNTTGIAKFEVSEGTTLVVAENVTTKSLTVTGNVDVEGALVIAGNLTVLSNGQFTVKEDAQASADNIFLGIKADDFTVNGSAAIAGEVTVMNGKIYVADGNTIDEKTVEGKGVVKYVVEGATWMTVYGTIADTVNMGKAPVENADFVCWNDKDGEAIADVTFTTSEQVITAQVKYDIYSVSIIGDNGIGTVAIDGVVLYKQSNMFIADNLVAGTHTISFELKNGYEGTVKMTVNGQAVSGYQFTLSGTDAADRDVTINLSGTAPAEPTTPVTPTPTPSEKDDGMGITDYLLIVLVIMVVILAIVVIARMFRS